MAEAMTIEQSGTGVKVLVAEDEAINRMYIVSLLEARGISCVVAKNGREAIEAFARERFDVVLMDLGLPGIDGLNASREIRKCSPEGSRRVPIAALTAHDTEQDRVVARESGIDTFITKPFSEVSLVETVEALAAAGNE